VNVDFKPWKAYITVFLPSGRDILKGVGKVKKTLRLMRTAVSMCVIRQKSETVTVVGESQGGEMEITGKPTYIKVGNECYADANYNKICDRGDETQDEPKTSRRIYVIAGIGALIILLLIAVLAKR